MSRARFKLLVSCLGFDNKDKRAQKWKEDRFAAIRDFFEQFNLNCSSHLVPGPYMAIDETLYPSRGKIGFKDYNPMKPGFFFYHV